MNVALFSSGGVHSRLAFSGFRSALRLHTADRSPVRISSLRASKMSQSANATRHPSSAHTASSPALDLDPMMAIRRITNSETRKNAATTTPIARNPPVRASITVQKPPGPQRDAKTPPTSTDAGVKNFHHDITASSIETPHTKQPTEAEQLMFQGLSQLQEIHDASNIDKITMERTTFQAIARTFQKAYEQIKTNPSTPAPTTTSAKTAFDYLCLFVLWIVE